MTLAQAKRVTVSNLLLPESFRVRLDQMITEGKNTASQEFIAMKSELEQMSEAEQKRIHDAVTKPQRLISL